MGSESGGVSADLTDDVGSLSLKRKHAPPLRGSHGLVRFTVSPPRLAGVSCVSRRGCPQWSRNSSCAQEVGACTHATGEREPIDLNFLNRYEEHEMLGKPLPYNNIVGPITYAITSAALFGTQVCGARNR